nr:odorant receptor 37 [Papilio glaucus]
MSGSKNLKEYHPQKYYLKIICQFLYCFGLGDFWYEKKIRGYIQNTIYIVWVFISNTYIFLIIINEFLAYLRKDLTDKEKGDLVLFSFAHPSIVGKILVFYIKRREIMDTLQMLLEENRKTYNRPTLDKCSVKRAKFYCTCLFVNIFVILVSATSEGIKNYFEEGIPIRTEVTYLPKRENSGIAVNVFRFLIQFHWWFIMAIMYSIDCLSICSLVFLSYRFKNVRLHFGNCRLKMKKMSKTKQQYLIDECFENNFVIGIKLHQDALRCARRIQMSLGKLYTVEVVETISMLVICLLKLTISGRDITLLVKNFMFISCVILLNGTYMMSGGDVTHEASLISDSVFYCGWEYSRARRSLRSLVVVALQQSQVPIRMTAFGVLSLSYSSFITVLRLSYSFFAVMY